MKITVQDYFGPNLHHPDVTQRVWDSAEELLDKVNRLLADASTECGYNAVRDADTGTCVSGSKGGTGGGGWRPQSSTTGASNSKHKTAHATDVYDPHDMLDDWLSKFDEDGGAKNAKLEEHGLYREHPEDTPGWLHLQDIAPGSGRRTFRP